MSTKKIYRPNVAVVVLNDEGKILGCERSDVKNAWQLPQGGINKDESTEDALMRELEEEIGTSDVDIIGKLPHTISYDWPKELYRRGFHGQEQTYFLVRIKKTAVIDLHRHPNHNEFSSYEWLTEAEFLPRVKGFKRESYVTALKLFKELYPGIIQE